VEPVPGDLADLPVTGVEGWLDSTQPTLSNLTPAPSRSSRSSFRRQRLTANITGTGVLRYTGIRMAGGGRRGELIRFHPGRQRRGLFGRSAQETPQTETLPDTYAVSIWLRQRVAGHDMRRQLPQATGCSPAVAFFSTGVNAVGVRDPRGHQRGHASKLGLPRPASCQATHLGFPKLRLGGYAGDYVKARVVMLQQDQADDFASSPTLLDSLSAWHSTKVGIEELARLRAAGPRSSSARRRPTTIGDPTRPHQARLGASSCVPGRSR